MVIIIIGGVIGGIISSRSWLKDCGWDWFMIVTFICGCVPGAIVGGLLALALPANYKTDNWCDNLESIQDNNAISGKFFLGSGLINSRMGYVYYVKEDSNTYRMWQTDYDGATIRYSNEHPKICITYRHFDNSFWNYFAIDLPHNEIWKCIFYIPKGSIKQDFNLDAK